jgi:hypothetical protein
MSKADISVTNPQMTQTGVVVRPKYVTWLFVMRLVKPILCVDGGSPKKVLWGTNFVPLLPGRHSLRCYVSYAFQHFLGDSTIEIEVPPEGVVTYEWKSPWLVFLSGKWKEVRPE